jgi:hypothetical protein
VVPVVLVVVVDLVQVFQQEQGVLEQIIQDQLNKGIRVVRVFPIVHMLVLVVAVLVVLEEMLMILHKQAMEV